MIPKVNRYYFYLYRDYRDGDNPLSFVQLIAHAEEFVDLNDISVEQKDAIRSNIKLCQIFFENAWSSRDGLVYFIKNEFSSLDDTTKYYNNLLEWAKKYGLYKTIEKIEKLFPLINQHFTKIKSFNWEQHNEINKIGELFLDCDFNSDVLKIILQKIINDPNSFCRDENGNEIDLEFSGTLKSFYGDSIIDKEYTVLKGKILGECKNYFKGQLQSIVIQDGSINQDSIKRWHSNGQIEFEKSYNTVRYWHKNGQLKLEKINGDTTVWDDQGNITKTFKKAENNR